MDVRTDCMRMLSLCIYITNIMGNVNDSEGNVFAFPGCNATLGWNLRHFDYLANGGIWNPSGINIAWIENFSCDSSSAFSVYCYIRVNGEVRMLYMDLINVTEANGGGYTAQIRHHFTVRETITKQLTVIGKPEIKKSDKIVLSEPLNISCAISSKLDEVKYRWKMNGRDFISAGRINANSSSLIFQRLWTVDKSSVFSCDVCQDNSCCIESETFALNPYYGPNKVDLDVTESHIYLNENEHFAVNCTANCNPVCSFWWEGYVNSDNETLVIVDFDARKSGKYVCNARNKETDIMAKSDSIFLYLAEGSRRLTTTIGSDRPVVTRFGRSRLEQYWMGPLIVSVFLVIVVLVILVTHWGNKTTTGEEVCQPCVKRAQSETSPKILERPKLPLPCPAPTEYPKTQKKSMSCQKVSYQTRSIMNQVREIVPLQTCSPSSTHMKRQTRKCVNNMLCSYDRNRGPCRMVWSTNESRPEKLFARIKRDPTDYGNDNTIGAKSTDLRNARTVRPKFQEDLYSTIDEDVMSVCLHGIDNVTEENPDETERSTEHVFHYNINATEKSHVETVNMYITDEAYITPVNDLTHQVAMCQDEERELIETNHTYLDLIDDLPDPTLIALVEETDKLQISNPFITPINGYTIT